MLNSRCEYRPPPRDRASGSSRRQRACSRPRRRYPGASPASWLCRIARLRPRIPSRPSNSMIPFRLQEAGRTATENAARLSRGTVCALQWPDGRVASNIHHMAISSSVHDTRRSSTLTSLIKLTILMNRALETLRFIGTITLYIVPIQDKMRVMHEDLSAISSKYSAM